MLDCVNVLFLIYFLADVSEAELLIMEMLQWFKFDFFTWTDSPKCASCQSSTHAAGMATPTEAELMWGASRVENYQCTQCSSFTRFPRYNHPGKLLETRTGRCGEWANCFTLCCRSVNVIIHRVHAHYTHCIYKMFSRYI